MGMTRCSSSACKAHSSWDKQFLISETSNDRDFKSSLPGVDRETSKDSLLALARKARLRARRELGEGENILKLSSFIKNHRLAFIIAGR